LISGKGGQAARQSGTLFNSEISRVQIAEIIERTVTG
jgi:hypothetical protein